MWLKIKAWTKFGSLAIVALFALIFGLKNASQDVKVWLWNEYTISVLNLLLWTVVTSVVGTLLFLTSWRTLRQLRRAKVERLSRQMTAQQSKAAMLQTRPVTTTPPGVTGPQG